MYFERKSETKNGASCYLQEEAIRSSDFDSARILRIPYYLERRDGGLGNGHHVDPVRVQPDKLLVEDPEVENQRCVDPP